jgi:hypothetical protein
MSNMRIRLGTFKAPALTLGMAFALALGGANTASAADNDDRGERRGHHERNWSRDDDNRRGDRWQRDDRRNEHWRNDHRRGPPPAQHWDRGNDRRPYYDNRRPAPIPPHAHRGRDYWGPHGSHWSRWNNGWGDPRHYARQWGFDEYHASRGWRRGSTWYVSPSDWSGWGGWSWSIVVGGGNNDWNNNYAYNNCRTYRAEDWINGRRAIVSYVGCADNWGRVYEQPVTRQVERWVW